MSSRTILISKCTPEADEGPGDIVREARLPICLALCALGCSAQSIVWNAVGIENIILDGGDPCPVGDIGAPRVRYDRGLVGWLRAG